jgi:methylated-DNA-[protein]-cysteine S-methyltransferase
MTTNEHAAWATYESPLGPLTLIGSAGGLRGLSFPGRSPALPAGERDPRALAAATTQLDEYFAGDRQTFDLPLELEGTAFQQRVWRALQRIPYGTTTSYGALAEELEVASSPGFTAARKVAGAVAATPTPIIVPCHRVIAADGRLTGYVGGLRRKRMLLDFEAARGLHDTELRPIQLQLALS